MPPPKNSTRNLNMFFNSAVTENTTARDVGLFCQVMSLCQFIRDKTDKLSFAKNLDFNCHPIHRAIAQIIPELRCVDGYYFGLAKIKDEKGESTVTQHCSHSWLVTPDEAIIDAYPCGYMSVNPVLVVAKGSHAPHGGNLYIPNGETTDEACANRTVFRKTQVLVRFAEGWKYRN